MQYKEKNVLNGPAGVKQIKIELVEVLCELLIRLVILELVAKSLSASTIFCEQEHLFLPAFCKIGEI